MCIHLLTSSVNVRTIYHFCIVHSNFLITSKTIELTGEVYGAQNAFTVTPQRLLEKLLAPKNMQLVMLEMRQETRRSSSKVWVIFVRLRQKLGYAYNFTKIEHQNLQLLHGGRMDIDKKKVNRRNSLCLRATSWFTAPKARWIAQQTGPPYYMTWHASRSKHEKNTTQWVTVAR